MSGPQQGPEPPPAPPRGVAPQDFLPPPRRAVLLTNPGDPTKDPTEPTRRR
jgi:hypothetical protein